MNIRTVTAGDYGAVENMALALHREMMSLRPDLYLPLDQFYSPELFAEWVRDGEAVWLLAEEGGEAVGICLTRINAMREMVPEKEACVDLLFVYRAYRRRGIVHRLLTETERRVKAKGVKTLTLSVSGENQTARRVYESMGMKVRSVWYEKDII